MVYFTNSSQLSLLPNIANGFTHQLPLTITIATLQEPTLTTTFTRLTLMIGFEFQQPPPTTIFAPLTPQQILSSNNHSPMNKLQRKSTSMTTLTIQILDYGNKLLRPTSRSPPRNQLILLRTNYNYKLWGKSPLINNFNNHLQLGAPTTTSTINFTQNHF